MTERIINSVADDDLYNFNTGCFLYHKYPGAPCSFTYKNRSNVDLRYLIPEIEEQIKMMQDLTLTLDEAHHLKQNSLCTEEYLDYLTKTPVFRLGEFKIKDKGELHISYRTPSERTTMIETKLLALISELHFRNLYKENYREVLDSGDKFIGDQIGLLNTAKCDGLSITEMGGRRRFSYEHQEKVLLKLWKDARPYMKGTSNVHLGMKHDIPYHGTIPHLLFMFMQSVYSTHASQIKTLEEVRDFFKGGLKVALTDTFGDAKWDRDFNKDLSDSYPWERHDSGDPFAWGERRISSAIDKGLDPRTRGLLFSDSLNIEKAIELTRHFRDRTNVSIGMGTFLTNSMGVPGHKAVSQVAKMTWANGVPLCKLSADFAKNQCEDMDMLAWCKKVAMEY